MVTKPCFVAYCGCKNYIPIRDYANPVPVCECGHEYRYHPDAMNCENCGRTAVNGGYYWTAEEERLWLGDECAEKVAPLAKKEGQEMLTELQADPLMAVYQSDFQ